jgi:hypothetical protein
LAAPVVFVRVGERVRVGGAPCSVVVVSLAVTVDCLPRGDDRSEGSTWAARKDRVQRIEAVPPLLRARSTEAGGAHGQRPTSVGPYEVGAVEVVGDEVVVVVVVVVVDRGGVVTNGVAGGIVVGAVDGVVTGVVVGMVGGEVSGATVVVVVLSGDTQPGGGDVAPCCPGMRTVPAQPKSEKVVSPVWLAPSAKFAVETVWRM